MKYLSQTLNGELKNWKLSIKANLLLMLKLIYFYNPFVMTFILKLNFSSSCIGRWESHLLGC